MIPLRQWNKVVYDFVKEEPVYGPPMGVLQKKLFGRLATLPATSSPAKVTRDKWRERYLDMIKEAFSKDRAQDPRIEQFQETLLLCFLLDRDVAKLIPFTLKCPLSKKEVPNLEKAIPSLLEEVLRKDVEGRLSAWWTLSVPHALILIETYLTGGTPPILPAIVPSSSAQGISNGNVGVNVLVADASPAPRGPNSNSEEKPTPPTEARVHPPSSDHGYILASKLPHQPQLEATESRVIKEEPEDDPISPNLNLPETAISPKPLTHSQNMVSTTSLLVSSILKPHQVPQENHFRSLHTTTKDLSQNKVVPISYPALSALKPPRLPLPVPPIPPLKTARKNSLANIEADSSTSSESSMPFSSHEALVIHPPSSDHGYILASKLPHQPQLEATETEVKKEVPEDDPISPNLKLVEEAAEAVRNKLHSEVVSTTSLLVSSILKPHQVPQENHFRSLHTTTKDLSQNTVVPNSFPALSALKPPRLPPIPPLQIAGKDSVASIEAASSTSSESSILSVRPLPSQGTGIGEREAPRENKEPEGFDPFHGDIKPLTPQNPPPRLGKRRSKDTNGEITEVHRYMTRRNTIESTAPIVPGTKKARRESKKSSHGANTSLGASSSTTLPISSTTTPAPKAVVEPDATPVGSIRIAYFVDPALAPLTLPDSEGGAILKKSDGLYPTFMCNAVLFILKDPALLVDRILPEIPMAMILVDGTPGKDAKAKVKMIPEQKRPNALLRDIFWAIMRQI